jgi:hypothetical protein
MISSKGHGSCARRSVGLTIAQVDPMNHAQLVRRPSSEDTALYAVVLFVGLVTVVLSLTAHPVRWGVAPTLGAFSVVLAARCLAVTFILGFMDRRRARAKRRVIRPS